MRASTDWFLASKWGVFVHYLADVASNTNPVDLPPDDWNRRVDGFDVDGLAAQLEHMGAGYFILTLGQNSGFYLSPNATYDSIVGHVPSHCSQRDLVADLAAAVIPRGIRMMVYFTAGAPCLDRRAIEALKCTPPWDPHLLGFHPELYTAQPGVDDRMTEFQTMWEAVIREWSERWGESVSGWWIDGCYVADKMYREPDAPNFASFAAAMKTGNPASIVAFNPGVMVPVICHTEFEDYTAGEIANAFPVTAGWHGVREPLGRYVDGAQYHILTFLGHMWGQGKPRFCDETVIGYTRDLIRDECVITWDVPPTPTGLIPDAHVAQLTALGRATR
jgi:hypothetical protein